MNKKLLLFSVILLVLVVGAYFALRVGKRIGVKTADLKGHLLTLEVVSTDPLRMKGLSDRDAIAKDAGMLFLFDGADRYAFWMKDMRFPIDIIYLNDSKIVTIFHSVQPYLTVNGIRQQNLTNYVPSARSNRVLEVNAGLAQQYGLKVGDTIDLKL